MNSEDDFVEIPMDGNFEAQIDSYIARVKDAYIPKLVRQLGGMSNSEVRELRGRSGVETNRLIRDIAAEIIARRTGSAGAQ